MDLSCNLIALKLLRQHRAAYDRTLSHPDYSILIQYSFIHCMQEQFLLHWQLGHSCSIRAIWNQMTAPNQEEKGRLPWTVTALAKSF